MINVLKGMKDKINIGGLMKFLFSGTREWRSGGVLHRDGGPAVKHSDGAQEWFRHGKRHRDGGPAIERADGTKAWYRNGLLHCQGGPAIERADGTNEWYFDGRRHRADGPAIERADGYKSWYLNGHLHREDGPAVEPTEGAGMWFRNGKFWSDEQLNTTVQENDVSARTAFGKAACSKYQTSAIAVCGERPEIKKAARKCSTAEKNYDNPFYSKKF